MKERWMNGWKKGRIFSEVDQNEYKNKNKNKNSV